MEPADGYAGVKLLARLRQGAVIRFYGGRSLPRTRGSARDDCKSQGGAGRRTSRLRAAHPSIRALERPANLTGTNAPGFGSDVVADTLRALDIPYIALNPGASYRGLHDSIVNYLGNETPQMLLCLHEESAVAIAHGYAKVTGKAMAAAVHSNVGLFHATMAIFNAWCDRMPVDRAGRDRPGRRRQAPSVDRLDPHRARPGRDRARLHQVGRPARLAGRCPRGAPARHLDRQHRADGTGLHQSRRRDAGGEARRAAAADRCRALHAAGRARRVARAGAARRPRCSRPPSTR